jgi:hypothetical protein
VSREIALVVPAALIDTRSLLAASGYWGNRRCGQLSDYGISDLKITRHPSDSLSPETAHSLDVHKTQGLSSH